MRAKTLRTAAVAGMVAVSLSFVGTSAASGVGSHGTNPACSPKNITGKTTITFWDSAASGANKTEFTALVNAFNKSQKLVTVDDTTISSDYETTYDTYLTDLGTSAQPQGVYMDMYAAQGLLDSKGILPVSTCIKGTNYKTTAFAKKSLLQQTTGTTVVGLPYGASAPVLYYNENAFKAAKISKPPTTFAQWAADGKALVKAGYKDGIALKDDPWWLQVWSGDANQYFVNHDNGRAGRATAVAFNDATSKGILTSLQDMVKSGEATEFSATAGSGALQGYDNLLAIANGYAGMSIDTSAALGEIAHYLPLFPKVKLGVAPIPVPSTSIDKDGVQPGGNALYINSQDTKAQAAATWEFLQYLDSANNLAAWDAATGYVPITTAAASTTTIKNLWRRKPYYKIAYTEILTGKATDASVGPALGCYYPVNTDISNALVTLLTDTSSSVITQLGQAATNANNDIKAYNATL